ncbi:hypothetical protein [Flavobacterium sp. KACC 22761]|nr:hypothetical protein [Flavobacterium sp. KACC 22761]WPO80239.1 hypothetical protein SCB73_07605 [Flavobacterium sp. KACC 22761]
MNLENLNIVELNFSEIEEIEGGFIPPFVRSMLTFRWLRCL